MSFLVTGVKAQSDYQSITYANVFVDYDSAISFKNLKLIPVRPKQGLGDTSTYGGGAGGTVSLSQALKNGWATVSERGTASIDNVHYLRINNNTDKNIYIAAGEIMAGGRQDRMITRDTLLAPSGHDQYVYVMCVEEGRWSDKEKKFAYDGFANPALRKVLDKSHNQPLVWQEIGRQIETSKLKTKSDAYLSHFADKKLQPFQDEYFKFFQDKFRHMDSTICGFVAVSGDTVLGSDIFANTSLFYSMLEPLLKGYCDQAFFTGKPVTLADDQVKKYMDKVLTDEKTQEEFLKDNGKIFRQGKHVIHLNSF